MGRRFQVHQSHQAQGCLRLPSLVALIAAVSCTVHSVNTRSFTTVASSPTLTLPCNSDPIILTAAQGRVEWAGALPSCYFTPVLSWLIQLPEHLGVIFNTHELIMQTSQSLYCQLRLFISNGAPPYRFMSAYVFDRGPGFFRTNTLLIHLETNGLCSLDCRVSFSYYGHPLTSIPPEITDYTSIENRTSDPMYDCSSIPTEDIPDVIRCDMVRHCLGGEDEAVCVYRQEGCGDWIPYRQHCLKVDKGNMVSPLYAEESCITKYGAKLAVLPDDSGVKLVARIVKRSGWGPVIFNLKRVRPVQKRLHHLYRFMWQWGERGSPVAHIAVQRNRAEGDCVILLPISLEFKRVHCFESNYFAYTYVCIKDNPRQHVTVYKKPNVAVSSTSFPNATKYPDRFSTKACADGSLVQTFHSCHWSYLHSSPTPPSNLSVTSLPMFQCQDGPFIHYSLVCDGNKDCADNSDELNCRPPRFTPLVKSTFVCENFQLIPARFRCDGVPQCLDDSDEQDCKNCSGSILCSGLNCVPPAYHKYFPSCPKLNDKTDDYSSPDVQLPALVAMDGHGMSKLIPTSSCPEGYFTCHNQLCILTCLLNNGEQDCPHGEDENIPMENLECPGYYRCQGYGNCVHAHCVCNGIPDCPNRDDELYCDLRCPAGCTCDGYAFTCRQMIDPLQHLLLRYLDISGTPDPHLADLHYLELLVFLNLSASHLTNVTLTDMPQLRVLDLSFNVLTGLSSVYLEGLPGLESLNLSGNPLVQTLDRYFSGFLQMAGLSALRSLMLTSTDLTSIEGRALEPLSSLTMLDIRGSNLVLFDEDALYGLNALQVLYTDNPKLCCSYFHNGLRLAECYSPRDELSSCTDLLRSNFFRVFLWAFSLLAMAGNTGVLVYWVFMTADRFSRPFSVLITNLCGADIVMGVYMMMIGAADAHFHGVYVSREAEWRESTACRAAGFLAFVSSEVSAFIICLVTLDRVLMIRLPLKLNLHMTKRSALTACGAAWVTGFIMAAVPLMAQWDFYGQSSICLPLPITRRQFPGQRYAFGVFIVLNCALFLIIGAGQVLIMRAIKRQAGSQAHSKLRKQEAAIAWRLMLIVLTDFLCWFPISVMGLLAATGTPVPSVVNVWATIFMLPINSVLNPFIYTINMLAERWKQRRLEEHAERVMSRLQAEIPKLPDSSVEDLIRICQTTRTMRKGQLLQQPGLQAESMEMVRLDPNITHTSNTLEEDEKAGPSSQRTAGGDSQADFHLCEID